MLQSMREKARSWVTFVIVGIIAFMMAITGLETLSPNPNNPNVATVNGEDITRAQLNQSLEQQRRMLIQQMGDQFDPSLIDEKLLTESVLQSLIDRTLLLQEAKDGGMGFGQEELDQMIVSMPEFQQDGKFNQDRFMMMVRSFGMSPMQFRSLLKDESVLAQIQAGVSGTEFVTTAEIEKLTALENQKRDIAWLTLDVTAIRDAVVPSDEQIQAYYDANAAQYMTPEQVVISYVEMDKATVASNLEIDEQDVRDEYQRRVQELEQQSASQTVSTILIQTGDTRSAEEAVKRAEEVIAKLEGGADFAEMAKEYSDDPVTAGKGGDLGVVSPGFFGDEFDEAVEGLEVGQISQPVETSFGVQVLKVTSRDKAEIPAFEALKDELVADLKLQEADALYLDKTRQLADISFESSDLVQPAEQLGLEIKTAGPFTREGGVDISADPKVSAASFSDDVLELGANSELLELSPEKALVLRVKEHMKPEPVPLDQVKDAIVQAIKVEEARKQLEEKAQSLIAELSGGADLNKVAEAASLTWTESEKAGRRQQAVPVQLITQAFKLPHPAEGQASFGQAELANGDVAVIALKKVHPGKASEADAARNLMMANYLASGNGRNLFGEYLKSLKETAKIKIKKEEE